MAERSVIEIDLNYIKDITGGASGDTLKKCYQCATCSSVCPISSENNPFPRKEMLWAGWGLKDRIAKDSDIWLCHQCSDCTEHCPRGAKPGEVIGALRRKSIEHYSPLGFLNKLTNNPIGVLVLLAIPAAIIIALLKVNGTLSSFLSGTAFGKIVFSKIFPQVTMVDPIFIGAVSFAGLSALIGLKRFWGDMKENAGDFKPTGSVVSSLIATVTEIIGHKKFQECGTNKKRRLPHQMLVFAFIGLATVTGIVAMNHYSSLILGQGNHFLGKDTPLILSNPVKILANVSGILLILGILILTMNRLTQGSKFASSFFDWSLILVIACVGITGFLSELMRLSGSAGAAYISYFLHLVFIFYLFAFMPYTKFAHLIYRTTALVFAKYSGRDVGLKVKS